MDQEWPYLLYEAIWAQFAGVEHSTDMLCLGVFFDMNLYVTYMLEKEGKKSIHQLADHYCSTRSTARSTGCQLPESYSKVVQIQMRFARARRRGFLC